MIKKYKLAVLTSHPIQYQAPCWCELAHHPQIDLMVYYFMDYGITEKLDPEFGVKFKWDIPLLDGYRYKFLKNYSPRPSTDGFLGLMNPGILRELARNHYDAIFVHSYAYATQFLAIIMARLMGTKVLIRNDLNLLVNFNWKRSILKKIVFPLFLKMVNRIMAIGQLNQKYYERYGVPPKKIHLMHYAVDNDWFFNQSKIYKAHKNALKNEYGIDIDSKVILFAAKFLKRKRAMDLILAFEQIEIPAVALVMVGNGEELPACESYVKERNLQNIFFMGFKNQSELPKFYALADVFVLPSESEPWGLVLNEAMCFGLPIVATDRVGAAYDLVKKRENGFMYPMGDIKALKNCLEIILKDSALQSDMGKASLDIIKHWNFKNNVESILAAIER